MAFIEVAGRTYDLAYGRDVINDLLYLEVRDRALHRAAVTVFYSRKTAEMSISLDGAQPLELVEQASQTARRELPALRVAA